MSTIKEIKKLIREELNTYTNPDLEEGCGDVEMPPQASDNESSRMHRTILAHLMADVKVLLDLVDDNDNLPPWVELKIIKAGDYMSSAARYIAGDVAREAGQLQEEEEEYYHISDATCGEGSAMEEGLEFWDDVLEEAEYQGRKVTLNKPTRGDVKKFKVFVKDPKTGNVKKVNFGDPNMRIKKSNPARRKSFRARHKCATPGPKTKARYWSCKKW
jgi:hypothetical protein